MVGNIQLNGDLESFFQSIGFKEGVFNIWTLLNPNQPKFIGNIFVFPLKIDNNVKCAMQPVNILDLNGFLLIELL